MANQAARWARRAGAVRGKSDTELSAMFGAWVDLGEDFGAPGRRRLFFPLAGVLDVPGAGPLGRPRLP
ncbi:MAG: hypothetical protein JRD89_19900 [Deltaproteobacteria bacterium]|nr:hypothetical protein [Deltaproteobacteria bacterium]